MLMTHNMARHTTWPAVDSQRLELRRSLRQCACVANSRGGEPVLAHDVWSLLLGVGAGLACGFLNTAASSGSAVSLPILMLIGLDPASANATNRIPVLIGAISATTSFHAKGALPWGMTVKVSVPAAVGGLVGAVLAELIPARDLGLIITIAVLAALLLLFTKLKQAIEQAEPGELRFGPREIALFFGIGIWLGFIVLDGATYMLLALTLVVGLKLVHANAVKSATIVPVTLVAMLIFGYRGSIDWALGAFMGAGSVVGGVLGARLSTLPDASRYIFVLLVFVLSAEVVHLFWHYAFQTH
jgi:uncharacterized protein